VREVVREVGPVDDLVDDVADRLDALARAAVAETIPPVVPLDAPDIRGMEPKRASSRNSENRPGAGQRVVVEPGVDPGTFRFSGVGCRWGGRGLDGS
jgi:hypothetical protein